MIYAFSRPRFVARFLARRQRTGTAAARPRRYRLALEALEDRLVMSGTGLPPPPPNPTPSPNGPVAVNDSVAYYFDQAAPLIGNIYSNDTDPNAGASIVPGSVSIVTPPRYGTALADPSTGQILYTPNTLPASQTDTFTYQVRDTLNLISNVATVTLSPVGPVFNGNHILPQPDLANTVTLKPVSVNPIVNDTVVDGSAADPRSVTLATPPQHGSAVVDPATGIVTYTPDFGFVGFEDLSYTVKTTQMSPADPGLPGQLIFAVYPAAPRLQADPLGGTMLVVDGTSNNDTIRFDRGRIPADVLVTINGVTSGPFRPTSRIVAFGYGGDDQITVASAVTRMAWLDGGAGNDVLRGGGGRNIMLGRDGNDVLVGGSARDLLIGGTGQDVLLSNGGGDLLIAGSTSFDDSQSALAAVMREWTSNHTFAQRVLDLFGVTDWQFGQRLNGNTFLAPASVQNDESGDNVVITATSQDLLFVDNTGPTTDVVVYQPSPAPSFGRRLVPGGNG